MRKNVASRQSSSFPILYLGNDSADFTYFQSKRQMLNLSGKEDFPIWISNLLELGSTQTNNIFSLIRHLLPCS